MTSPLSHAHGEIVLEILGEEIPARMQSQAAKGFARLFTEQASFHGLDPFAIKTDVTPRRLALTGQILRAVPDRVTEHKGPKVDGDPAALEGFMKRVGVLDKEQLHILETPKGRFYGAHVVTKGGDLAVVMPMVIDAIIQGFSWPKSMRWGRGDRPWIRPIHQGICVFDGQTIPFVLPFRKDSDTTDAPSVTFGGRTHGHRFLSAAPITVTSFQQYQDDLRRHHVMVSADERRAIVASRAAELAQGCGGHVVPDDGLLDEVTGLVEWPVLFVGSIDPAFMGLPKAVLMTVMRVHQRYFAVGAGPVADPHSPLAPFFIITANIAPSDGGKTLIAGNERVLRARLSDAAFFYENDLKVPLAHFGDHLGGMIFHEKLGTLADKVQRITDLAVYLAPLFDVPVADARLAASLCKNDLASSMVREFPELQGIMGADYARRQGLGDAIADALWGHYAPRGAGDGLPPSPLARLLALADRLDTLVGFFAAGIRPTGSKDPFALRRAVLGIIRLLEVSGDVIPMHLFAKAFAGYDGFPSGTLVDPLEDVHAFMLDRLRVYWREQGFDPEHMDGAFDVGGYSDSIAALKKRVQAVSDFLSGPQGADLLEVYHRANAILAIEEKRDGISYDAPVRSDQLLEEVEKRLFQAMAERFPLIDASIGQQDFMGALGQIASLQPFMAAFFHGVIVNAEDGDVRLNRLSLLAMARKGMSHLINFARIRGDR